MENMKRNNDNLISTTGGGYIVYYLFFLPFFFGTLKNALLPADFQLARLIFEWKGFFLRQTFFILYEMNWPENKLPRHGVTKYIDNSPKLCIIM